jgi:cephalosporin hydroxylase
LEANLPESYTNFLRKLDLKKKELLESPTRFQKISDREERSDIPANLGQQFNLGKNLLEYGGVFSLTGALDVVIYSQLFGLIQPQTVFELGSLRGGSALSIANTLKLQSPRGHVYSVDIDLSLLDPRVKDLKPDNLTFIEGDMYKIEEVFPSSTLKNFPRPWVMIEDAHANSLGVLEHFHKFLKEGDYIIYDDSDPFAPLINGMGWEGHPPYEPYGFTKLHMLKGFMMKHDGYYCVDSYLTDLLGYNATNNWNGYVRRMK